MPLPAELKLGNGTLALNEKMSHEFTGQSNPGLERATVRFYQKLSTLTNMNFGEGESMQLILNCTNGEESYPSIDDDESYSIHVLGSKIIVQAPEDIGIIYALETLLQLVENQNGEWVIPRLSLKDSPRYPWRGLMIDACRHWIPKKVILRNLEAMGTLKMNVFHWHLTENQGFRVESFLYPKLHTMGSSGDYYTQDDIREVVEYAADRGIRVVPEFDVPGHTAAWFVGHPELASGPGPYELNGKQSVKPAMDPTRDEVYDFLDAFFGEMTGLFPDAYLHIGGDEVVPTQWEKNPDIQRYMKEHNLKDSHALQAYFNIRLQKIVAGHGKIMMGWDEILHPNLPKEGITVQTWRGQASLWESARLGNKAVLSAGYYLDYKEPAGYHYSVDPTVITGAVNIEIDSSNWKAWKCNLSVAEMTMDGALYLFGEGDSLRGIMNFMGGDIGFEEASLEKNHISFIAESTMGKLKFDLDLDGDSISGTSKISVFNLELTGQRSGGTDMVGGIPLPEFRKIEALTPEQETNLLGGEACMWTEMVDATTIDSRIWPRAGAIAEKMWSPKILTDDVPDMYRRLMVLDIQLENLGIQHLNYRKKLLSDIVSEPFQEPLRVLTEVLQEDKKFERRAIYQPYFELTTPLNRIVDVARPESYVAYRFGQDVDLWIESADSMARERMILLLKSWSVNYQQLTPAFEDNERLLEVKAHSEHLSQLARIGLEALSDPTSLSGKEDYMADLFDSASASYGATNLPITQHVKKLMESATKN